ncbi:unnamed protein product [Rotaria sordida]|uniref:Major facilitator superfamily (MFS) profile domain-containing protein n=1 Tax=Rotaria sordida TaxID=392033 RepID=A0A814CVF6_9BILA|nr:unnamed protein product [Rotaria sordida]CAF0947326.1 unnamed protein product [Rotaria sordida]CAF0951224.1 unnamed protein product [Rotaria sordida]
MTNNDKKIVSIGESVVPDGGWGWIIVFSSFMIHFIMDGITYSMGQVFLEPMRKELSLDRASVSSIFGILPAVTLGAGPIATVLTNMYGCRPVAIAGSCIAAFGFFLARLWTNIWFYYITIGVIGGIGFALMYLPAIVSVSLYFEQKRAFAMGIAVCGSGVGTFVLSYIMNRIVNISSWLNYKNALIVEASIILFGLLCGSLMVPLPQEPSEQRRLERKAHAKAKQKQIAQSLISENVPVTSNNNATDDEPMLPVVTIEKLPTKSFFNQIIEQIDLNLLKNAAFTLFAISNFLASLGFNVVYNYADDLANDSKVIKDQRTYIVMSIGLSNIFGRFIIGYLGDQKCMNRLLLFILTLIISGVATMIAPLCGSSIIPHIGYASFFGFFSGGYVALTAIVLVDIVGINKLSDAFGVLLLFIGVATAIGTPTVGAMRDAFSHFTRPFLWPYFIFGSCTVVSGIMLFAIPFLQRKKSNDNQTETNFDTFNSGKDLSFQEEQQNI